MITPKDPPYKTTKVDPLSTQMNINKLLKKYGITKYIWTSDYQLAIELESKIEGEIEQFYAVFKAPMLKSKKRTRYGMQEVPNDAQRMRCLFWWLKAKIESVAYGFETAEKAFLSDIIVKLPSGQMGTVHQLLKGDLLAGKLALPSIMPPKEVEGTPKKTRKMIDVDYETVQ